MDFEIIDFHTHPFLHDDENLCKYTEIMRMNCDTVIGDMDASGIGRFCGSVIKKPMSGFDTIRECNKDAYTLQKVFNGRYIPGIQVHPYYLEESEKELEKASKNGIKLVGELVPYIHKWSDYSEEAFSQLLDIIESYDMVVNLHTMDLEQMYTMAQRHRNIRFVFAHPGEKDNVIKHAEIMMKLDNVSLDISGTGIYRYGVLRYLISRVGAERILFGTDYPIGNPGLYINAVMCERISDKEREMIFSSNIKQLLSI